MRITKVDGEIIDYSIEEYNQMHKVVEKIVVQEKQPEQVLFARVVKEVEKPKTKLGRPKKAVLGRPKIAYKERESSCKAWKKSHDKFLMSHSVEECLKEFPDRSLTALYSRRSHLNLSGKYKFRKPVKDGDKRVPRMQFIMMHAKKLITINPQLKMHDAMKSASDLYKQGIITKKDNAEVLSV
jgi:hypothetical protein